MPDVGHILLEDLETGELIEVNTADKAFRQRYFEKPRDWVEGFEKRLLRRGIDCFGLSTNTDYVNRLREFFKLRENRRRGSSRMKVGSLRRSKMAASVQGALGMLVDFPREVALHV